MLFNKKNFIKLGKFWYLEKLGSNIEYLNSSLNFRDFYVLHSILWNLKFVSSVQETSIYRLTSTFKYIFIF